MLLFYKNDKIALNLVQGYNVKVAFLLALSIYACVGACVHVCLRGCVRACVRIRWGNRTRSIFREACREAIALLKDKMTCIGKLYHLW